MKKFFVALTALLLLMTGCGSDKPAVPLKTTTIKAEKSSLEISTPFDLKDTKINDFDGLEAFIKKSVTKSAEQDGIMLVVSCNVFDVEKIIAQTGQKSFAPDLNGGLIGAVANMKNVKSTGSVTDIKINGIDAKEISGTVEVKLSGDENSSVCDFRIVDFAVDNEFWMVMLIRKSNDKTRALADEIIKSMKLS